MKVFTLQTMHPAPQGEVATGKNDHMTVIIVPFTKPCYLTLSFIKMVVE